MSRTPSVLRKGRRENGIRMTEEAGHARRAMVQALERSGMVHDRAVLDAMGRIPREWFVPRFWTFPAHARPAVREWRVENPGDEPTALQLIYDIDRALAIRVKPTADADPGRGRPEAETQVTATVSAPTIVGSMLELLELQPGMRVLEIGAGSGYNAALLRELVGPTGAVTSVDIDAELVEMTTRTLHDHGWDDVRVIAADGYVGAPDRAPFDRVVATVGCVDVAPAWLEQLAPAGWCLLPLEHDGWHPLTRVTPCVEAPTCEAIGEVVGRSGFVAIQGHQSHRSPWPGRAPPIGRLERSPLPARLARDLASDPEGEGRGLRLWDLAYLVALEDRRATSMAGLASADSLAAIDPGRQDVVWSGPRGSDLRDRLLDIAGRWEELGCPTLADYRSTFSPVARAHAGEGGLDVGSGGISESGSAGSRGWVVDRIDFRQSVQLA